VNEHDPLAFQDEDAAQAEKDQQLTRHAVTENDDVKWLMGTKRGRRIVWRQLDRAGVFRISFSTNAMAMAFAEGSRNEGLRLLALIHSLCPDLYVQMVRESNVNRTDPSTN
jgi:hypothetical protein